MFESGDHAWLLVSAALVMFMTPGLALFYGGMVRSKNILGMLMMNFFSLGLTSLLWAVLVYSLAFGGTGAFIGNFDFAWLRGLTDEAGNSTMLDMAFQMTFAVITVALITGAVADRIKFSAWAWFMGLWVILVYGPVARWIWQDGAWLADRGGLDFAGGAVVHINAGVAALAAVIVLGRRKGWPQAQMPPHSLPLTLIGAGILWFGWFGFNAGSAYAADGLAVQAWTNTHLAAATAMLSWLVAERIKTGNATTLGAASGLVAGLVAITPCAGYVSGMAPIFIGGVAGVLCFLAISLKFRFGYDDSLDVVGIHGVGGLVGALMLGLLADEALAEGAAGFGWFLGGGADLFIEQIIASGAVMVYSFVVTIVILLVLRAVLPKGLRVTDEEEDEGLDLSQHAESAYSFGELGSMARE